MSGADEIKKKLKNGYCTEKPADDYNFRSMTEDCCEDSGIILLARHLASSKLAAVENEARLRSQIKQLEKSNTDAELAASRARDEAEFWRMKAYQLELENSKKWRVEERDDWRALVSAIQDDRKALQFDNEVLESRVAALQAELETATQQAIDKPLPRSAELIQGETNVPLTVAAVDISCMTHDELKAHCAAG